MCNLFFNGRSLKITFVILTNDITSPNLRPEMRLNLDYYFVGADMEPSKKMHDRLFSTIKYDVFEELLRSVDSDRFLFGTAKRKGFNNSCVFFIERINALDRGANHQKNTNNGFQGIIANCDHLEVDFRVFIGAHEEKIHNDIYAKMNHESMDLDRCWSYPDLPHSDDTPCSDVEPYVDFDCSVADVETPCSESPP